jgi:uncharacterized protein (TIGR03437 family)
LERGNTGGFTTTGGRLTAVMQALTPGTLVTVPSLGSIYLAGQPGGTHFGTLSAPSNSPTQATVAVTPGQGMSILASGQVGNVAPEGASGQSTQGLAAAFGISGISVQSGALLGVFTGDTIATTPVPFGLNFSDGDLVTVQTLYPLLQQVFYIGNGVTPAGLTRVFVPPAGATRLFLASAAGGFIASGSFVASISPAAIPTPPAVTNPVIVPGLANLAMIDEPNGTPLGSGAGLALAVAPYSVPPQVPITLTAGQSLAIRSIHSISTGPVSGVPTEPGISALQQVPGLSGVFVGDTINRASTPASLPPSQTAQVLAPALQQSFYIGDGLTPAGQQRTFTVPTGATRLFLAAQGGSVWASGSSPATVNPVNPNAPAISAGGIVTNAGFSTGPVTAGSLVAIFGSNFGPVTSATTVPLPTNLGGTQVFFDSVPAPLFYVSPTQLVVQVPFEMYTRTQALVEVVNNGIASLAVPVNLAPFAPGIFTTGTGAPVITDYNTGQLVSPSAPASRGDTIVIWATGLGPTVFDAPTGNPAPNAASATLLPIQVILKSASTGAQVNATMEYAGLAPGFIGLNQINVQIPQNAPTGTVILELLSPSVAAANPVTIGIQ